MCKGQGLLLIGFIASIEDTAGNAVDEGSGVADTCWSAAAAVCREIVRHTISRACGLGTQICQSKVKSKR